MGLYAMAAKVLQLQRSTQDVQRRIHDDQVTMIRQQRDLIQKHDAVLEAQQHLVQALGQMNLATEQSLLPQTEGGLVSSSQLLKCIYTFSGFRVVSPRTRSSAFGELILCQTDHSWIALS